MITRILFLFLSIVSLTSFGQKGNIKDLLGIAPLSAIKEEDLRRDLFTMADDKWKGREAGTIDEMRISMWLAEQAKAAGMKPAGDDGSYFQFFMMLRSRISSASKINIGGKDLSIGKEILITHHGAGALDVPVVYAGKATYAELNKLELKGKAVAVQVYKDSIADIDKLAPRRYMALFRNKFQQRLIERGAVALIFIMDDYAEQSWSLYKEQIPRGTYDILPATPLAHNAQQIWLRKGVFDFSKNNLVLKSNVFMEQFETPSVNVVAKIEGRDPELKKEYVLFSGHQDHDGIRHTINGDSIFNGADDNASVSVALLAIGRAFYRSPGRRSALFVWHGAEERGLLGSRWYSAHPTVPKSSIAAVLNGDMIGRNNIDSAALLGVQPPHRNSQDLVNMALAANNEGPRFKLDTLWDKTTHLEGWYFRSDHLPYARAGVPAIFFTTLLHPEYHTPFDEAKTIDIAKLKKMTEWMFRTGYKVANAVNRPAVEAGFKLER